MTTPPLPPNHEPVSSDFLRQHGAVKGMRYHNPEWSYWLDYKILPRALRKFTFCAPLGTIGAATTPVPEGRCDCPDLPNPNIHLSTCRAHPRNAYVHIPPHLLAQLPEKPEGLISRRRADKFPEDTWDESTRFWPNHHPFHPDYVYAVPRHVLDRIEQQLSTKGGDSSDHDASNATKPPRTHSA